jgi:acetoin utilization deacetylase AcuC-like enzyme
MVQLFYYYPEGHEAHFENGHPERPERVEIVRRSLEVVDWWQPFPKLAPVNLDRDWLSRIHHPAYLDALQFHCEHGAHLDEDTYTTKKSWQLALNSAGGAAALAEAVWRADGMNVKRGFALCRPPGHHAERANGMGFCLLNNVAVAAEYLLHHPLGQTSNARRVAVIDLDLHHGNGTQDIFYKRQDVLYISTHQSPLYPGTGMLEETGLGEGLGFTVNLPLPPGTGDVGFLAVMDTIILPLLDRYQPEILLVSVGFDPHWRDPLGYLLLSADGFGQLIRRLVAWADQNSLGRVVLVMEGGYDSKAISACSLAATAALLGEKIVDSVGPSPRPEGKSWQSVQNKAKEIWGLT